MSDLRTSRSRRAQAAANDAFVGRFRMSLFTIGLVLTFALGVLNPFAASAATPHRASPSSATTTRQPTPAVSPPHSPWSAHRRRARPPGSLPRPPPPALPMRRLPRGSTPAPRRSAPAPRRSAPALPMRRVPRRPTPALPIGASPTPADTSPSYAASSPPAGYGRSTVDASSLRASGVTPGGPGRRRQAAGGERHCRQSVQRHRQRRRPDRDLRRHDHEQHHPAPKCDVDPEGSASTPGAAPRRPVTRRTESRPRTSVSATAPATAAVEA